MRKLLIFLLISILFITSGCSFFSLDTGIRMDVPENKSVPLYGKWKIIKCLKKDNNSFIQQNESPWLLEDAQFSEKSAKLGSDYWVNLAYKIKRIDPEDYFLFNVGAPIDTLNLSHKDINVITITSENRYLYDIIMTDDGFVMTFIDNNLLYLEKQSGAIDNRFDEVALDKSKDRETYNSIAKDDKDAKSGVIVGIKSEKNVNSSEIREYSYRSLWISTDNKVLRPILETRDILLPRMDGFWTLKENRIKNAERDENIFIAEKYPESDVQDSYPTTTSPGINLWGNGKANIYNNISYVGNDYISIETIEKSKLKVQTKGNLSRLWLVPIDSLANPKGVKIFDIAGQTGANALGNAKNSLLKGQYLSNTRELNQSIEYENFGIFRKTGHWIFKGRFNYMTRGIYHFNDFRVNLIPPTSVVYYDTLSVPWTAIKDRVPEATDAFTSPRKDIAIIRTSEKLLIYAIDNGVLRSAPLKKIKLNAGDTIIMAEWAGGKYVQKWENIFKSNNIVTID